MTYASYLHIAHISNRFSCAVLVAAVTGVGVLFSAAAPARAAAVAVGGVAVVRMAVLNVVG